MTTFIKITNRDIYDAIQELKEKNTEDHGTILIHQKQTNGKVKLNRWIATTALTLVITTLFGVLTYLIKFGVIQ